MKIWELNPVTGKRSELLNDRSYCVSWTSCSYNYAVKQRLIEPIEGFKIPKGNQTHRVTLHIDAGIRDRGVNKSLLHETKWVIFCQGLMSCGEDSFWEWIILPPKNLIKKIEVQPCDGL